MSATFTDDEVGKSVENAAGEEVGVVASVEGDVAHVRPAADAVDSIKSSIGWDGVADETRPLDGESVREITADAVRLEGDLSGDGDDAAASEPDLTAQGGDEAEPETEPAGGSTGIEETEIADDLREGTDADALEETDSIDADQANATDAERQDMNDGERVDRGMEVDPTELTRDDPEAEFDPGEQPRRTDAEVDPDAVRDAEPSGGPTTEDASREDLEDGPEERRLDRDEE